MPTEYAALLVDVAGRFGARADRLLADSGVQQRMLDGTRVVLPRGAALLDQAVVTSDDVMARRVERACQAELAALDRRLSFVSKVRRDLRAARRAYLRSSGPPRARWQLGSHPEAQARGAQGRRDRALVEELRRERAVALLRDRKHALEVIATTLGYADKASFHRAFRRWFGTTPAAFRAGPS